MVDLERRKKLALHLRYLCIGLISNDDFEESVAEEITFGWLPEQYHRSKESKSDDPIIIPILELCWGLYDDTRNHKIKLEPEALKVISRIILFLHSGQEYKWPYYKTESIVMNFSILDILLTFLSFGVHYQNLKLEKEKSFLKFKNLGDYEFWPFFRKEDFDRALFKQPFLKNNSNLA
jgi:hypothetical protein